MRPYLLIDFGSTYTKMTAVDLDEPKVLGTSRALTTVQDGLLVGYRRALEQLHQRIGILEYQKRLACSSAAGGLKMAAVGLVPELTVEAAKRAALGAGARVIRTYGYELTPDEVQELVGLQPDLVLLAGGTDGGNARVLLHNADQLSKSVLATPIILAGNKSAAPEAEKILTSAGKECYRVANVLPELNRLNIEPVQQTIRELFFKRIIHAKGLDQVERLIDGITMPTPAAALDAATLLADGPEGRGGLGELLLIDVGGATTDVHSVAQGAPTDPQVSLRGLPESRVKRTVEGDLGMRYSAQALLETVSAGAVAKRSGLPEGTVIEGVTRRSRNVAYLPQDQEDWLLEAALGYLAVAGAVERHVGRIEKFYTPSCLSYIQTGKDLTRLPVLIGTGGILAHSSAPGEILRGALFDPVRPEFLKPQAPKLWFDRDYLLPTLGLIAKTHPQAAFSLLKQALHPA